MKLTATQLRRIIKEEISRMLNENSFIQSKVEEFQADPSRWEMAMPEIIDMAAGGDGEGTRSYYSRWEDQDFKDLLVAMGEKLSDYNL